jgi:hypothetical protein
LVAVKPVGKLAQGVGYVAQGADGLGAHLGDDGCIDIGCGVTNLHLDELDGFFNALPNASITGAWRRIAAHGKVTSDK